MYGSLGSNRFFHGRNPYDPRSPYSASKASSDHFVMAYHHTYHMPVVISNCSNNYGSHQFPEKLIPLMINNIRNNKPLPVYGKGENIRDWLWVDDHARAIDVIFHKGKNGEKYNIGGFNEWKNIDLVHLLCSIMDKKLGCKAKGESETVKYVKDRPGHDLRYAIDASKLNRNWDGSLRCNLKKDWRRQWNGTCKNQKWIDMLLQVITSNIISTIHTTVISKVYFPCLFTQQNFQG